MTWQMTMTNIGRNALAAAIADESSAVVTAIALFTAQFTGSIENATTLSDFTSGGGYRCALIFPIEGQPLYDEHDGNVVTGHFQVSGSDITANEYEAKTVVLCIDDNGTNVPFMAVTVSDPDDVLIIKADVSAVTVVAMLAVENAPISSISFGPAQFVFPPADEQHLGSVRITDYVGINYPGDSSPYSPQTITSNAFYYTLFYGGGSIRLHDISGKDDDGLWLWSSSSHTTGIVLKDWIACTASSRIDVRTESFARLIAKDYFKLSANNDSMSIYAHDGLLEIDGSKPIIALPTNTQGQATPLKIGYKDENDTFINTFTSSNVESIIASDDVRVVSLRFLASGTTVDSLKTNDKFRLIGWGSYAEHSYSDYQQGEPENQKIQFQFSDSSARLDLYNASGDATTGVVTTSSGTTLYGSLSVISRNGSSGHLGVIGDSTFVGTTTFAGNASVTQTLYASSIDVSGMINGGLKVVPGSAGVVSHLYSLPATSPHYTLTDLNNRRTYLARFIISSDAINTPYNYADEPSKPFFNANNADSPFYQDSAAIKIKSSFLKAMGVLENQIVCGRSSVLEGSQPSHPINAARFDGSNDLSLGGLVVNNATGVYLIEVF